MSSSTDSNRINEKVVTFYTWNRGDAISSLKKLESMHQHIFILIEGKIQNSYQFRCEISDKEEYKTKKKTFKSVAKNAEQKIGYLLRLRQDRKWTAVPISSVLLRLLYSIQRSAAKLINNPVLIGNLLSLEDRRRVGELSIFYRYQ